MKDYKPFSLIIEGSNLSGKSSVFSELEQRYTDSIAVNLHGYYYPELRNLFKSQDGSLNLSAMVEYGKKRLYSFLDLLETSRDVCLLNRFHLTDVVYLKLYHNTEEHYHDLEDNLNKMGVYMVLLDVKDGALKQRLQQRAVEGKTGPWDRNLQSLIQKRDAYREAFEDSKMKNKLLVDTSNRTARETTNLIENYLYKKCAE